MCPCHLYFLYYHEKVIMGANVLMIVLRTWSLVMWSSYETLRMVPEHSTAVEWYGLGSVPF